MRCSGVCSMRFFIWLVLVVLAGCGTPGGVPLVSATSPPGQGSNTEPQPVGSLPPGAAGVGRGPNATHPDFLAVTLGR